LNRFWPQVIRPLLEVARPKVVLEIGAGAGAHTRRLAKFCRAGGITLHMIDPAPRFDPSELDDETDQFVFHRARSLEVLADLEPVDVALIDGDHNWYTVSQELRLLQGAARAAGHATPVVVCHDVGWPYGRRDGYYDPDTIPAEHCQPWQRAGILPGKSPLVADGGLNARFANADHEGGPRNGVLTAIEDFLDGAGEPLELTMLPELHGLAILAPRSRLDADPALERAIAHWGTAEGRADLAPLVERKRQGLLIANQELSRRLAAENRGGETFR
jgi:Methyltransferase domain